MKNFFLLLIITVLFFAACNKNDEMFLFFRKSYSNVYMTRAGGELRSASIRDTASKLDAYYARITGTFTNLNDTIIQYGHCWSTTNTNPFINPRDTSTYSRLGTRQSGKTGIFESRISNLNPETQFWVRSYIITANKDTGYSQVVYTQSTLRPTDTWFKQTSFNKGGREDAIGFSMQCQRPTGSSQLQDFFGGYYGGGRDATYYYKDFYEFDPTAANGNGSWQLLAELPVTAQGRSGAVAFAITYTNNKTKITKAYYGLGQNLAGDRLNDFYEYDRITNKWTPVENFPGSGRSQAVAFSVNQKGYVGLGESKTAALYDFYKFDPLTKKWSPASQFPQGGRKGAVAFIVNDKAFVATGIDQSGNYKNDLWMFIPGNGVTTQDIWIQRNNMPIEAGKRAYAVGFSIDDQGYVGTGFNGTNLLSDFWRYDPFNDRWIKRMDHKNGGLENDPLDDNLKVEPKLMNGVGFGINDRGYLGSGFMGNDTYSKYSSFFWVYRP